MNKEIKGLLSAIKSVRAHIDFKKAYIHGKRVVVQLKSQEDLDKIPGTTRFKHYFAAKQSTGIAFKIFDGVEFHYRLKDGQAPESPVKEAAAGGV